MAGMHDAYLAHFPAEFLPEPLPQRRAEWWKWRDHDIHVERTGDENAPTRLVMLHGAGGHAAMLWPTAAVAAAAGCHVVVPDLPGYGQTRVPRDGAVRYHDWVAMACEFVLAQQRDDRPLWLVGASMGGLLAYDVATRTGAVDRVVATALLDPREPVTLRHLGRWPWIGPVARNALRAAKGPVGNARLPARWLTNMRAISNQPHLTELIMRDNRGGGNRVPLGFLRSFLNSAPAVEPDTIIGPEIVLAQPAADRWTPLRASLPFFDRITAPKKLVMLEGGGHFPVESSAVRQLLDVLRA